MRYFELGLLLLFSLLSSYIHPDEHFQSIEVIGKHILGYSASLPWEFNNENPARSLVPLYILYGPIAFTIRTLNIQIKPIYIWFIFRIQNSLITYFVLRLSLTHLTKSRTLSKARFLSFSSYIILVYHTHCFSNAIETWLVLVCLCLITTYEQNLGNRSVIIISLSFFVVLGTFNRITFPAFMIFPSLRLIRCLSQDVSAICMMGFSMFITSILFIILDTLAFRDGFINLSDISSLVITPWNNFAYNTNKSNLSLHGIHPWYTHLLINIPQVLGPSLLIPLIFQARLKVFSYTFLSMAGAVLILSFIPHQELRFLLPVAPLYFMSLDINNSNTIIHRKCSWKMFVAVWYAFNFFMSLIMGLYHQGGVIPALEHLRSTVVNNSEVEQSIQVWWRTYSVPLWVYGDSSGKVDRTVITGDMKIEISKESDHHVLDCMGLDYNDLIKYLESFRASEMSVYLILPRASFLTQDFNKDGSYEERWTYKFHLDMDHLDIKNTNSLIQGLAIYELI